MSATDRTQRAIVGALAALGIAASLIAGAAPANAAVGGAVSGTVTWQTGPGTYGPATAVTVTFYPTWGSGDAAGSTTTNASGQFTIAGLEQGDYRVRFAPTSASDAHAAQWLGNTPFERQSSLLSVGASAVTGVTAALPTGGSIAGTISTDDPGEAGAAAAFLWNPTDGVWERFSRWTNASGGGSYTIRGLADGQYLLRFADQGSDVLLSTEYWNESRFWSDADLVTITGAGAVTGRNGSLVSGGINQFRLQGSDRFATAVRISRVWPGTVDAVFVVDGLNFPDALSAAPAAASIGAPVLLTAPGFLPSVVAQRLAELDPQTIYIVGGEPSVGSAVEDELAQYADEVIRFAGANRFETSRLVADAFFDSSDTVYVATGLTFPDALSSASAAANESGPVVLLNGGASELDAATAALLDDLGASRAVIAGSAASVSAGVEAGLRNTVGEVYRRDGVNRFDTAVKIARGSFEVADAVFIATGLNYPDALAGAALAGNSTWRSPLYLVQQNCIPPDVLAEIGRIKPAELYLLGGLPSLGSGVAAGIPCS